MNFQKKILCLGIIGLLCITFFSGCMQQSTSPRTGLITIPALNTGVAYNPKYTLSSYYSSEKLTLNTSTPHYTLPLDLTQVLNLSSIDAVFSLTSDQKRILEQNGFVVRPYFDYVKSITEPYTDLKNNSIPIFITTDTLLHLYHIQFDQVLKSIEEREFFNTLLNLSKTLFDYSQQEYLSYTGDLKEAARRNVGFFAVAFSLLQTPTEGYNGSENIRTINFIIPSYVSNDVSSECNYIEAHDEFHDSPLFHYKEDYTQYIPRGHYTQSETLKRYFKAMMWLGRISFLMKGGEPACQSCDYLISAEDAKIQTIQASLIAIDLSTQTVQNISLLDLWTRMYSVTSFFVGTADDLTPYEYLSSIRTVFGSSFNATELGNDTKLLDLKKQFVLLRSPQIYGGTGEAIIIKNVNEPINVNDLNKVLEKTKGMRFMGQRFIPDSYIFQQLVFPATGKYTGNNTPFTMKISERCLPRGLDIMAILGSERALQILTKEGDTAYENYTQQLTALQQNFSSLNITEWNRNLYFSWVYTLKSLIQQYDTRYPTFMSSPAWQDKELQTALSSWTELRHDTILYAKQSYTKTLGIHTPMQEKPVVGYVEPVPEFYNRILALTKMTTAGLTALHVLNQIETTRLNNLASILSRLLNISKSELEGKELNTSDYAFIRDFGDQLDSVVTGVNEQGKETTLVADVHTDTNDPQQVLEEGVGYVDLLIVAYKIPDGRIIAGAGPVFSYYEFKQPVANRLTDDQWNEMLLKRNEPSRPTWTSSFFSK